MPNLINTNCILQKAAARRYLKKHGKMTISVFKHHGRVRYTGHVTQPAHKSKPSVMYRIKIKWKNQ